MSKKAILAVAAVVLAAGAAVAVSAPGQRGLRMGPRLDDFSSARGMRLAERLKEMDTNKDGTVSLQEFLSRRDSGFTRMDKNGDGTIDASDLRAVAQEQSDYWGRRFLKRFDTDRDGKVSKEEFAKAPRKRFALRDFAGDGVIGLDDMSPRARERYARRMEQDGRDGKESRRGFFTLDRLLGRVDRRFRKLDTNGDGFIDLPDLQARATEHAAFASRRFFRRFDANGDGKVTRDEFDGPAKERFAYLDLDDDGKITEADLPPRLRGRDVLK